MEGKRERITAHLNALLGEDAILLIPAAPGPAPRLQTPPAELDSFRTSLISLTCIAGLAKLPQVRQPTHLLTPWSGRSIINCTKQSDVPRGNTVLERSLLRAAPHLPPKWLSVSRPMPF